MVPFKDCSNPSTVIKIMKHKTQKSFSFNVDVIKLVNQDLEYKNFKI